jgi:hypothetical protein
MGLVLREAEELYPGQGRLMWFNFSSLVLHFFARITNSDQCLIHNGDIFTGILGHKFAEMFSNPKVISPSPNPSSTSRRPSRDGKLPARNEKEPVRMNQKLAILRVLPLGLNFNKFIFSAPQPKSFCLFHLNPVRLSSKPE